MFTVHSSEDVAVAIVRPSNNKIQRTGAAIYCIRAILLSGADLECYVTVHVLGCSLIRPQSSQGFWLSNACDTAASALRVLSGRDLAGGSADAIWPPSVCSQGRTDRRALG